MNKYREYRTITPNEWNQLKNLERNVNNTYKNFFNYTQTHFKLLVKRREMQRRLQTMSPFTRRYHVNMRTLKAIQNKINNIEQKEFHARQKSDTANNRERQHRKNIYERIFPSKNYYNPQRGYWFNLQNLKRKGREIAKINLSENVKKRLPPGVPPHLPPNIRNKIMQMSLFS
jgi:hypothetical protein